MSIGRINALVLLLGAALVSPAMAQISVLDTAQDNSAAALVGETSPAPPPCGTQPITIARMSWPSAELLAEIHARVLHQGFGCEVRVIPGDMAATGSSMSITGQPAIAPELWVTRIAEVWNAGVDAQKLRAAAPTFTKNQLEGWFIPDYLASAQPQLKDAAGLAPVMSQLNGGARLRFISCPIDWACAVINRNLLAAHGLSDAVEIIEPANRFEMDTLIAEAVSRREPFLFYYWRPNAVLAQFSFVALDMGAYDEAAAKCLARLACPTPVPSAFAPEMVVLALSEWVFAEAPAIAGYFQRASLPLEVMDQLLAQLNEPNASVEGVADRFIAQREDVWRGWVGTGVP